jgi:hypothetical protein
MPCLGLHWLNDDLNLLLHIEYNSSRVSVNGIVHLWLSPAHGPSLFQRANLNVIPLGLLVHHQKRVLEEALWPVMRSSGSHFSID